jgi:2-methylisocitrate lyase-like PEP mutase family enzyme
MFAAIARIARVVPVPVTADLEGGYGLGAEEFVARLLATGAVGCNIEDTDRSGQSVLRDPDAQAEYLAAVKQAGRAAGVDIVLNARIDVFVRQFGAPEARVPEAIRRARIYLEAGADCVYPIFVREEATIAALVEDIPGPVNIFALPDGPSRTRLGELGVARISYAGRLHRAALAEHQRCVQAIRTGAEM